MTESEWLASEGPAAMLEYITAVDGGCRVGRLGRKLRLFACACCRSVWHLLSDPRSRQAVQVAELYADGEGADEADRVQAFHVAGDWYTELVGAGVQADAPSRIVSLLARDTLQAHATAACANLSRRHQMLGLAPAAQAALLREIVGNPFRPVVLPPGPICPACKGVGGWASTAGPRGGVGGQMVTACSRCDGGCYLPCHWLTPQVLSLARAAYGERNPDGTLQGPRLMVLWDALEEAGCTDDAIRDHLCRGGPHVRGCWALDMILGHS